VADIGLASDLQKWEQEKVKQQIAMEAEHLDQKKYSTARTGRYGRVRRAMFG